MHLEHALVRCLSLKAIADMLSYRQPQPFLQIELPLPVQKLARMPNRDFADLIGHAAGSVRPVLKMPWAEKRWIPADGPLGGCRLRQTGSQSQLALRKDTETVH